MAQSDRIKDFLIRTSNRAADRALLLALKRAEAPYDQTIIEIIIDSGRPEGIIDLVDSYHQLDEPRQQVLLRRAKDVQKMLREAALSGQMQSRLNVLEIVRQAGCGGLSDVVAHCLVDRIKRVSDRAAVVLVELTDVYSQRSTVWHLARRYGGATPPGRRGETPARSDPQCFLDALCQAVKDYPTHQHAEAVMAAMQTVPADCSGFWQDMLLANHPVGRLVEDLLVRTDYPQYASFHLGAFKIEWLRPTTARTLANTLRGEYVTAMALGHNRLQDREVTKYLAVVKQPRWLDAAELDPSEMDEDTQLAMLDLIRAVGAQPQQRFDYLVAMAETAGERVAQRIADALVADVPEMEPTQLDRALVSPHEHVALTIVKELVRSQASHMYKVLVQQLRSPHESVRELARQTLSKRAFERFWHGFDKMGKSQRASAAKAVLKIDERMHDKLVAHLSAEIPEDRLRAVKIIRCMDQINEYSEEIARLSRDRDSVVRSCAVAALGQTKGPAARKVEYHLIAALQDKDVRVQANAIEALEQIGARNAWPHIAPFTQSDHHRLRANAVKVQLAWRVDAARKTIEAMISDPRQKHRRSAGWVVRKLSEPKHQSAPSAANAGVPNSEDIYAFPAS